MFKDVHNGLDRQGGFSIQPTVRDTGRHRAVRILCKVSEEHIQIHRDVSFNQPRHGRWFIHRTMDGGHSRGPEGYSNGTRGGTEEGNDRREPRRRRWLVGPYTPEKRTWTF